MTTPQTTEMCTGGVATALSSTTATPAVCTSVDPGNVIVANRVAEQIAPTALTAKDAAAYVGVSYRYLADLRQRSEGPAYLRLSDSSRSPVLYLVADLDAWLQTFERVGGDSE
ncbi:MAG: helix-turn-helix domain-containing protein [Corynebacterium sp.]|uniref:helix-turn-helix domain-containing protein n=1 Tax=Corynebacterium sp. TaxID=1720 RepID=UPI003F0FABD5